MDLLTTISTSIALAGRLREIAKNIENAEFKNILADLSLELADLKLQLAGVVEENIERSPKSGDWNRRMQNLVRSAASPRGNWNEASPIQAWEIWE